MSRQPPSLNRALSDLAEIALAANSPSVAWPMVMALLEQLVGFDSGFVATTPGTARAAGGAICGHDEGALRANIGPYLSQIREAQASTRTELVFLAGQPQATLSPRPSSHPPGVDAGVSLFFDRVRLAATAALPSSVGSLASARRGPFAYAPPTSGPDRYIRT